MSRYRKNREKITFTCKKCGKERTVARESYPEDEICGYCRSRMPKPVPEGGKTCNKCGEWKPYTEFARKKANGDGFETECKECRKLRKKEWREKNKEYKSPKREKITFTCKECGKERTVNRESYPEDEICSYCKRKHTMKEKYGYETNLMKIKDLEPLELSSGYRTCTECGRKLPLDEFVNNITKKGGIESICLECNVKRSQEWNKKNPEGKKDIDERYHENHKEEIREKNRKEYFENRLEKLEKARQYYEENKDKIKERIKAYRQTERGRLVHNASNAKRRALKEGMESDITSDYLEELIASTTHCEMCGREAEEYHLDHIIPLAQDGPHLKANVRYICDDCNYHRPKDGRDILGYFELDPSYSYEERKAEFFNTINAEHSYSTRPFSNRIVLTHQPHFYEVEKEMWKDWNIRKQIYINRIKYINRSPDLLNDREILRAFKISGKHYGFSHFSPFWIKTFIREYNISSIYDPCGGWGHRLLGAWNIDYYYNDIDPRTVNGITNIYEEYKDYNEKEKEFYNEDASEFILDKEYEAVFTCPPYFKKEEYLSKGTSTNKYPTYYDWINVWWRNVVKNTHPTKYFAFVIDADLKEDMGAVVEEEGYTFLKMEILGKSKSHFTKGRNEVLMIYS